GGGESVAGAAVEEKIHRRASAQRRLARVQAVRSLAVSIGGLVPLVLILLGAPWLLHRGATIGVVLGVLTYVLEGLHPAIQQLVRGMGHKAAWLFVALERILEDAEEPAGRHGALPSVTVPIRGHAVELTDVTFRYGPWAEP